ncbi:deoxyribose-phosphate aldolase [Aeropyrum pernix K1]|uniref:Deoxyribose-phosphate aldolase n=2 Tax=Aeropyrum pernix TaxID=56636 RepID=DEOC_AERPE|nr:deoxyribose-phosphate aldolase [Aeropyrum pernix]Q9Y948.2 RecName: Full=Deoxyribose-phosphate aldolase; Short=DERA; AltName: Full=2-deoxy-D-ribose 5-phosphate aldolase; AltName: Full=Phosphodeoxyriboaldolase; Short=Deoxyriboaldolase [Aeropyrum pernix K1]BAA81452.2 deoxyribose-phosphate aldolase [Aeropyrum pernix K1]
MPSARDILQQGLDRLGSPEDLASRIDSTLLSPRATEEDVRNLVREASDYGFRCAVLTPVYTVKISGLAEKLGVKLCSVIGFPLGQAPLEVKLVEAQTVLEAGATELDVVPHLSLGPEAVYREVSGIVKLAKSYGAVVKVILEAPLWDDKTLSLLVDSSRRAGADIVKTSTGVYTKGGDPVTVFRLASLAKPLGMGVKASGGIRSGIDAVLAVGAGADIIGTSSAVKVLESFKSLV